MYASLNFIYLFIHTFTMFFCEFNITLKYSDLPQLNNLERKLIIQAHIHRDGKLG